MAAILGVNDRYIDLIGGADGRLVATGSVERYSITEDTWEARPALNQPRFQPSAICLTGIVYVFAGMKSQRECEGSIERIAAAPGEQAWTLIHVKEADKYLLREIAATRCFALAFSGNEIAFFGTG